MNCKHYINFIYNHMYGAGEKDQEDEFKIEVFKKMKKDWKEIINFSE